MTRLRIALAALTCLGFSVPVLAQTTQPADADSAVAALDPNEPGYLDYRTITLDNGMQVVSLEDFSSPIVAVQVWYHVGSKDEQPDRQGFAHMFEHMMFRGTDRLGPKDHFNLIRQSGGDTNAYTSFDMTVYLDNVPANQLELALWLEAERLAFLKIDEESFYTERAVVEEERRLRNDTAPYGTVVERVLPKIFTKHPYRWTPIGQIAHLRAASIDELARFWETFYVPNNATLVVAGAAKHEDVQRLAEEYFGWIPRGPEPPRVEIKEPPQTGPRIIRIDEPKGPVPVVALAYRAIPETHPDDVALGLLLEILGGGESSRVYQQMVKQKQIAVGAQAGGFTLEQDGVIGIGAALTPGTEPGDAIQVIEHIVAQARDEQVSDEELTKARNQYLKSAIDDALTVSGKADLLGRFAVIYDDLSRVNQRLSAIRNVTAEDLQRVARQYLTEDRRTTVIVEPAPGGLLTSLLGSTQPAAATRPAENRIAQRQGAKAGLERPESFPATPPVQPLLDDELNIPTDRFTLDNGLKVVVVPNDELPLVTGMLALKFGAFAENATRVGAAHLAGQMVTQGTESFTSFELASELESNAISLTANVETDGGAVSATFLSDQADRAVRLMAEVVRRPTFPTDEFETLRNQVLSDLSIRSQTPEYLAERELKRRLFGAHPYARDETGEVADVRRLSTDDLRQWWQTFVRPDAAVLYLAGDIKPTKARELAETYFGDWQADGPTPSVDLPAIEPVAKTHIYLVDRPGLVQSQIRAAQIGMNRANPDWPVARVVTQIFGGGFNSRLNESLRVKKGLTYGANGYFWPLRFTGMFYISTFSKTESTPEAVQGIIDEVRKLESDPIGETELLAARQYIVGSFAGDRETPADTLRDLWTIEQNNLPADYLRTVLAGARDATAERVLDVARRNVDPDRLVIVVVGDADQLEAKLREIAPTTVVRPPATQPAKEPASNDQPAAADEPAEANPQD